jgi:ABC-type transport system involved in cytochrome bd biosynthesis fused ATPase/permease subunit
VSDITKATRDNQDKRKGPPGANAEKMGKKHEKASKKNGDTNTNTPGEPSPLVIAESNEGFTLKNLMVHIQKGDFVALVGRVGSGKSSVINALIGECTRPDER